MGRAKKIPGQSPATERRFRPAIEPEARELQMVSLAFDLVERRLREGTASAQETVHFLKIGSRLENIEREILEKQKELTIAKADQIRAQQHSDELYAKALAAFARYSGNNSGENDDDSDVFESDSNPYI